MMLVANKTMLLYAVADFQKFSGVPKKNNATN